MKKSFLLLFLLLSSFNVALATDGLCFRAIQGGVAVEVICAGQPVTFVNCSEPTPPGSTKIFYPGPQKYDETKSYSPGELLDENETFTFPNPGTYIVTLIINRGKKDANNQTITELFEREFEVKPAPTPSFTTTSCSNRTVSVTITDQQYDLYTVNYGDGSKPASAERGETLKHTFSVNGPYSITVTGSYKGATCTGTATETVAELPAYVAPSISGLQVRQQDATAGVINYTFSNLQESYTYTLTRKLESEDNFSTVATLTHNQTTHTLTNINTSVAAAYRIEATNACGTVLGTSNAISNIVLTATADNEFNTVQWQNLGNFQRMELYRNGELLDAGSIAKPYTDRKVVCEQEYCYTVKGLTADGAVVSTSANQCVTSYSTIRPPVGTLLATYNLANQVELIFTAPEGEAIQEIYFHRSSGNVPPELLTTTYSGTTYLDELSESMAVCYSAGFKNGCAVSDLSQPACPILLTGQLDDGSVILSWSAYVGFPDGVAAYKVEVLDENNQLIDSYLATGTTFTDTNSKNYSQLVRYRIKATANDGTETFSNLVLVEQEVQLHIPSGFTPNGDGLNDKFEVKGQFIQEFFIRIYNGMGQVVYTSNNREDGWDGTFNGTPLPAGAYAYEVTVIATGNNTKKRTGTVTLLR